MKKLAIGIMSGTSLDGIDTVLAEIEGSKKNTKITVINAETYKYDAMLLKQIKKAINGKFNTSELLCSLNFKLAKAYSKCVFDLCVSSQVNINDISFIASHGQTIYHIPKDSDKFVVSSLQLGDGSVLANLTNTTVISNFRAADIAAKGQGAPLVPYADYILFRSNTKTRLIQNIGGISNVTCIPKRANIDDVFAFDNGPGNMMIDYAMKRLFRLNYDKDGLIAQQGYIIKDMFNEILENNYFFEKPPKSTGRELFGDQYSKYLLDKFNNYDKKDIITTLTHITAYTIALSYKDFIENQYRIDEIIISGGGAYNKTLISLIKKYTNNKNVYILEEYGYSSNYKEALAFIILGNETINKNPSNVLKATGAKKHVILGQISYVLK